MIRPLRSTRCSSDVAIPGLGLSPSLTTTTFVVVWRRGTEGGLPVIVGEEVKSSKGDVIGLFLEEPVPPRLTPLETVKRVKDQGGLVGIPHPFDRIRPTAMGLKALLEVLPWVDFLEGYNGHTVLPEDNRRGNGVRRATFASGGFMQRFTFSS